MARATDVTSSGALPQVLAPQRQNLRRVRHPVEDTGKCHDRTERVRLEFERRHDAEIPAAAAQRPEQVGLRFRRRGSDRAVGADDAGRPETVDRQSVFPADPSFSAAEREPSNARLRHDAARHDEAKGLRLAIEITPHRAALDSGDARLRIEVHAAHAREIDDDAAVTTREAGHGVAAAPDGHQEIALPRERDGIDDVSCSRAPDDDRRAMLMHRVVDRPLAVPRIVRLQDVAADRRRELVECRFVDPGHPAINCRN